MCLAIFCKQSIGAEANLQNYQKLVIFEPVLPVTLLAFEVPTVVATTHRRDCHAQIISQGSRDYLSLKEK